MQDNNELTVWFCREADIFDADLIHSYRQLLTPPEQDRYTRFQQPRHQHQYLIARALLKHALSHHWPTIRPQDWSFSTNAYGKPHIDQPLCNVPLQFNLTHTDGLIAVIVSNNVDVGIDAEPIQRKDNIETLADSLFSNSEQLQLAALNGDGKSRHFYRLWTLKEAYIKAAGRGLSIELNQFSFEPDCQDRMTVCYRHDFTDPIRQCGIWQHNLNDKHWLSVVADLPSTHSPKLTLHEVIPGRKRQPVALQQTLHAVSPDLPMGRRSESDNA